MPYRGHSSLAFNESLQSDARPIQTRAECIACTYGCCCSTMLLQAWVDSFSQKSATDMTSQSLILRHSSHQHGSRFPGFSDGQAPSDWVVTRCQLPYQRLMDCKVGDASTPDSGVSTAVGCASDIRAWRLHMQAVLQDIFLLPCTADLRTDDVPGDALQCAKYCALLHIRWLMPSSLCSHVLVIGDAVTHAGLSMFSKTWWNEQCPWLHM